MLEIGRDRSVRKVDGWFISILWGMFSETKMFYRFRSGMVHSVVFHVEDCFVIPENHLVFIMFWKFVLIWQ